MPIDVAEIQILLKEFRYARRYREATNLIAPNRLKYLVDNGYLHEKLVKPTHCLEDDCNNEVKSSRSGDIVTVTCKTHSNEINILDLTELSIDFQKVLMRFIKVILPNRRLESTKLWDANSNFAVMDGSLDGFDASFFFIFSDDDKLLIDFLKKSIGRKMNILFIDSENEEMHEFLEKMQYLTTAVRLVSSYSKIDGKNIKELDGDVSFTLKILEEEKLFFDTLKDEKIKVMVSNASTNPRYILNALNLARWMKRNGKENWVDFENLTKVAFDHIFLLNLEEGGHHSSGEAVPDTAFYVRNASNQKEFLVLVDSKFETETDLKKAISEKYENYLVSARNIGNNVKVTLAFVGLNFADQSKLEDFCKRFEDKLMDGECVVFIPISSLAILLERYLDMIRNKDLRYESSSLEWSFGQIFNSKFLQDKKVPQIRNSFYMIKENEMLQLLQATERSSRKRSIAGDLSNLLNE